MRNGYLLAEAPPSELLESYQLQSLEEVFLRLCEHDDGNQNEHDSSTREIVPSVAKVGSGTFFTALLLP